MDKIDLAFSRVKIEMEKLIKENEFLKKKNLIQREDLRKIFIANVVLKELFDEETQRLIIDKN
jgi:hypothetical protein